MMSHEEEISREPSTLFLLTVYFLLMIGIFYGALKYMDYSMGNSFSEFSRRITKQQTEITEIRNTVKELPEINKSVEQILDILNRNGLK